MKLSTALASGVLAMACAITATSTCAQTATPPAGTGQNQIIVTLLGTGTPTLSADRYGFANLVQVNGLNLLFDAGRDAAIRLHQAGVRPGELDAAFLTHFHSDHLSGLPDVWLTGYIGSREQTFKGPFQLYGPRGTARIAQGLMLAFRSDAEIRFGDEKDWRPGARIQAHEISEGTVLEKNGAKVSAFKVDHGQGIEPALGYRIDYRGRSVVISGDTIYDERVIANAQGVGLLIHEVAYTVADVEHPPAIRRILGHHTSPEEVGRVFASARPTLAVYSHISRPPIHGRVPPIQDLIVRTRKTYNGPLAIGEDLMRFVVSDSIAVFPMMAARD